MKAHPRSWLFVPADSEKKIARALKSEADVVIFDLEDSVAPARKAEAREILKELPARMGGPHWWVRVNPLGSAYLKADLGLFASPDFEGVVLPKAEGGADVAQLAHRTGHLPVHAIVTETAARASLLTGLHPHQTGIGVLTYDFGPEGYSGDLSERCVTIPEALRTASLKLVRNLPTLQQIKNVELAADQRVEPALVTRRPQDVRQTLFHDADRPSRVRLPIVPA